MKRALFVTTCLLALTAGSSAQEELEKSKDQEFLRKEIIDLIKIHDMPDAHYDDLVVVDDRVIITNLTATHESGISIKAEEIWFEDVDDEQGSSTWLTIATLGAKNVELSYADATVKFEKPEFRNLAFLNLNPPLDGEGVVDGRFSAVKFARFNFGPASFSSGENQIASFAGGIVAADWNYAPTWPRTAEFKIAGNINGQALKAQYGFDVPAEFGTNTVFEIDGKEVIDRTLGFGTYKISANTSNAGAMVVQFNLSNMKKKFFDALETFADQKTEKDDKLDAVTHELRVSDVAAAFSSLNWLVSSGIVGPQPLTSLLSAFLHEDLEPTLASIDEHIFSENKTGTVKIETRRRVSIADLLPGEHKLDVNELFDIKLQDR